ncbi:MAG: hypothetical protein HQK79_17975 [Desulfobacterales bacterium]|nr:hypothetical protein [Desulfobacterales bacterium]
MSIISGIIGGMIVLFATKFTQKRALAKQFFKMFYIVKDYCISSGAEFIERMKDLSAESKAEYEKENIEK